MAQGPSDTILVAIRITLQIREFKVRNPDPPNRRRFVLFEYFFLVFACNFVKNQWTVRFIHDRHMYWYEFINLT